MNRREFTLGLTPGLASAGLLLASPWGPAQAQGSAPQEGRDFKRVAQPVPVPPGKVEVVEFFGYWCPHCNAFEPQLDAWVRKLPAAKVNFRRVPVAFQAWHETYQRLYFAVEALGLTDTLHRKIFTAIHVDKKRFDKDEEIQAFANANGADGAKILSMMKSFSIAGKLSASRQLWEGYGIDGVPTLGIQGRWMTSPSIAAGPERALAVTDALIAQAARG